VFLGWGKSRCRTWFGLQVDEENSFSATWVGVCDCWKHFFCAIVGNTFFKQGNQQVEWVGSADGWAISLSVFKK